MNELHTTDAVLSQIVGVAVAFPTDAGHIAALADRMMEATPEDRMAVLAWLVDHARRLSSCQASWDLRLSTPATKRTQSQVVVSPESRRSFDEVRYRAEHLKSHAWRALSESIDADHWYAVKFSLLRNDNAAPYGSVALRMVMNVTPLDGGDIREAGK